jgi:hypothetical protein
MNITEIASKICRDMVVDVAHHDGQGYIITPFSYPDGDLVVLYFDTFGGAPRVTDMGATMSKFRQMGLSMTESRKVFIRAICHIQSVDFDEISFKKTLDPGMLGNGCLSFCEAIAKISNLQYEPSSRTVSSFSQRLEEMVISQIEEPKICTVSRNWTDPEIDPVERFPIDYKFNGALPPRFMFGINSEHKALAAVSAYTYFLKNNRPRSTLAVIDETSSVGDEGMSRLQQLLKIVIGIDGNEKSIKTFAETGEL